MKKLLTIFCTALLFSTQSYATGTFVGVDLLRTHARHEAENSSLTTGPQNYTKVRESNGGYGVNLGVRTDPAMLFASAEAFYERLNSISNSFAQNNTSTVGPKLKIDDRYGVKANLGVTVLPWLTPFITYGVARVGYETDVSNRKTTSIYGAGLMFDLPFSNLSLKAAYDMQKFIMPYQSGESKTVLGVAHLGLVYNFSL